MYRRFNKFFNHMKKGHTDYGPRKYFEPTLGESNLDDEPLCITKAEKLEFGFGDIGQADFIDRVRFEICSINDLNEKTCGQISTVLNRINSKTMKSGQWNSRFVFLFTRKYMNIRPKF